MPHFVYKLISPRATFPRDMTPAEANLMQEHVVYWRGLMDKGTALLFGPVMDPKGVWGLAIVDMENEAAARALGTNDPIIRAGAGFGFEVYSIQAVVPK